MKEKILEISKKLENNKITENEAKEQFLFLFGVSNSWFDGVINEPPENIEIIAKSPDGILHLTSWRKAYNIFMVMNKYEDLSGWQWKYI